MFSATAAANSNVGNVGSFSFSGWNYDVQGTGGSRAIYRLNDQATFKVQLYLTFEACSFSPQVVQLSQVVAAGRSHLYIQPISCIRPLQPDFRQLFSGKLHRNQYDRFHGMGSRRLLQVSSILHCRPSL